MLQLSYKILCLHFKTNVTEAEEDKYIDCRNMWNIINFNYAFNRMECCLLPVLLLDVYGSHHFKFKKLTFLLF
jgi:hypothetical protein